MANAGFGPQLRQWRCGQHDRHQSLWRLQGVFFFSKASILGFHGFRRPNTNGSQFFLCTVAVGLSTFFFCFGLMLFQNSCAQNFLHKLEATPHLNGKHVVFGKVRSAKGAKGVNWVYSVYYFRGRCKMEFTWNFLLKSDMSPFNLLHKLKIMSCKSSCKICFFCPTALALGSSTTVKVLGQTDTFGVPWVKWVFSPSRGLGANWHACLLGFFGTNGFCLRKGSFEDSLKPVSCDSLRQKLWRIPQPFSTCVSQSFCGVKVAWMVDLQHLHSAEKTIDHVVAVGFVIYYCSEWSNLSLTRLDPTCQFMIRPLKLQLWLFLLLQVVEGMDVVPCLVYCFRSSPVTYPKALAKWCSLSLGKPGGEGRFQRWQVCTWVVCSATSSIAWIAWLGCKDQAPSGRGGLWRTWRRWWQDQGTQPSSMRLGGVAPVIFYIFFILNSFDRELKKHLPQDDMSSSYHLHKWKKMFQSLAKIGKFLWCNDVLDFHERIQQWGKCRCPFDRRQVAFSPWSLVS